MNIDRMGQFLRSLPDFPGKGFLARTFIAPMIKGKKLESIIDMKNPGGGKIICNLDDFLPFHLFIYGNYRLEKKYEQYMLSKIQKDDVIVDVGANMGYYSIQFARLTNGKVYSFEPLSTQFSLLKRNVELNKLTNDVLINNAVSDTNEVKKIYLTEDEEQGTSSIEVKTSSFEEVQCTTLDDYFEKNNVTKLDVLKMDIEGHEKKALIGMKNILAKGMIREFYIEIHGGCLEAAGTSPEDICAYLRSFGYYPHSIKTGEIGEYEIGVDECLVMFNKIEKM